jgi:hypothetical protein
MKYIAAILSFIVYPFTRFSKKNTDTPLSNTQRKKIKNMKKPKYTSKRRKF